MRYPPGHKDATRQLILEAAVRSFCRNGISDSGVTGIMAEVGLSPAGLYPHFASKDALIQDAVDAIMDATATIIAGRARQARESGGTAIELIVAGYLGEAHLDQRNGAGCAPTMTGRTAIPNYFARVPGPEFHDRRIRPTADPDLAFATYAIDVTVADNGRRYRQGHAGRFRKHGDRLAHVAGSFGTVTALRTLGP